MGRIKTKLIKRTTNKMLHIHSGRFTTNFEENKKLVAEIANIQSKKLRNVVAGYITRITKKTQGQ